MVASASDAGTYVLDDDELTGDESILLENDLEESEETTSETSVSQIDYTTQLDNLCIVGLFILFALGVVAGCLMAQVFFREVKQ